MFLADKVQLQLRIQQHRVVDVSVAHAATCSMTSPVAASAVRRCQHLIYHPLREVWCERSYLAPRRRFGTIRRPLLLRRTGQISSQSGKQVLEVLTTAHAVEHPDDSMLYAREPWNGISWEAYAHRVPMLRSCAQALGTSGQFVRRRQPAEALAAHRCAGKPQGQ